MPKLHTHTLHTPSPNPTHCPQALLRTQLSTKRGPECTSLPPATPTSSRTTTRFIARSIHLLHLLPYDVHVLHLLRYMHCPWGGGAQQTKRVAFFSPFSPRPIFVITCQVITRITFKFYSPLFFFFWMLRKQDLSGFFCSCFLRCTWTLSPATLQLPHSTPTIPRKSGFLDRKKDGPSLFSPQQPLFCLFIPTSPDGSNFQKVLFEKTPMPYFMCSIFQVFSSEPKRKDFVGMCFSHLGTFISCKLQLSVHIVHKWKILQKYRAKPNSFCSLFFAVDCLLLPVKRFPFLLSFKSKLWFRIFFFKNVVFSLKGTETNLKENTPSRFHMTQWFCLSVLILLPGWQPGLSPCPTSVPRHWHSKTSASQCSDL